MSTIDQTISSIWSMANQLRGNMDASEYRDYILGFMFYRYLSERQEQHLVDDGIIFPEEGESVNDAYARETQEDRDEYLREIARILGYAISPEYTWKTIVGKIADKTIRPSDFQDMIDSFNHSLAINPNAEQRFDGIFNDMRFTSTRLGASVNDRAKALAGTITLVDSITYTDENGRDILGDIYMYLIAQFAGNAGKKAGEFYTPAPVSEVLAKIVTKNLEAPQADNHSVGGYSVYDFACGSGSLLLSVQQQTPDPSRVFFYGQELNTTTYDLARMNLMMHNVDYQHMKLRNADTLEADWPLQTDESGVQEAQSFDMVVANPPYSANWDNRDEKLKDPRFRDFGVLAPKSKADLAFVLHGLYHLKPEGTMAVVLPHGVLFRGAGEGKIRKTLIEKNLIDAVIGLPANLFYSTGIPTLVMVLKKNKQTDDILFIDASQDFEKGKKQNVLREQDIQKIIDTYAARQDVERYAHVATLDEIKENDFNLNIPRYVDTYVPEPPIDLGELTREMAEVDEQIASAQQELLGMMTELHAEDPKLQADLDAFIALLRKEVASNE